MNSGRPKYEELLPIQPRHAAVSPLNVNDEMLAVSNVKIPTSPKTFPQGITELPVQREMLDIIHSEFFLSLALSWGKKKEREKKK